MASVNKVILIGNLGKDPEVRHLEGGVAVARLAIATSETYKDKAGERQEKTEWHNIVLWRGLAEVAEKYVKKGHSVYIEGKLQTSTWEKDGVKQYSTEIVADRMTMLGGKDSSGSGSTNAGYGGPNRSSGQSAGQIENDEPDDLPF